MKRRKSAPNRRRRNAGTFHEPPPPGPKPKLPPFQELLDKICLVDRTRGILVPWK
jgi:hypothetical protein